MSVDQEVLEVLRQIALHRETAMLLELRARQAMRPEEHGRLARRAAHRRLLASRPEEHLQQGKSASRHPSALG
ncbi:hypothetical protein ACI797_10780 [Geodermatophilus sp. SYSU D00691]